MIYEHSGDLGDLVAALPAIATKGAGELRLYPDPVCGNRMTPERADDVKALLEYQPYIHSVTWHPGRTGGVDLGSWRSHYVNGQNLADMVCTWQKLPHWPRRKPWMVINSSYKNLLQPRVVIARTDRWRVKEWDFPWRRVMALYADYAAFVGTQAEHDLFCKEVGEIRYHYTENFWHLANTVAQADLVIANQTCVRWLAEAF